MAKGPNIWRDVTEYIRARAPRGIHNDDIAKALDLTRQQVRACVTKFVNRHPEGGIVESRPWVYTYTDNPGAVPPANAAASIAAATHHREDELPVVSIRKGGIQFPALEAAVDAATKGATTPIAQGELLAWELLRYVDDGDAVLLDHEANVWRARRLT